jgi:hypothetical protein
MNLARLSQFPVIFDLEQKRMSFVFNVGRTKNGPNGASEDLASFQ